jgi:hypothetical protein
MDPATIQGRETMTAPDTTAIEMAPFTLAEGMFEETLLAASERLEMEFLSGLDGYLGRMLVRKDDRSWSDIVFWRTPQDAARAMERAASSEVCRSYFECMAAADHDDPAQGVTVYQRVRSYGSVVI